MIEGISLYQAHKAVRAKRQSSTGEACRPKAIEWGKPEVLTISSTQGCQSQAAAEPWLGMQAKPSSGVSQKHWLYQAHKAIRAKRQPSTGEACKPSRHVE